MPPAAIEIQAQPIPAFDHRDPSRRRFGMLELPRRPGADVARSSEFGGISSINVAPDGANFIAATDRSWWLRGRITYAGTRPTGIADAEMAPMLGPDGRTLRARGWYDTEAMARDGDTVYVGIERVHRIVRFDYGKDGLLARGRPIEVPAAFRSLPSNGSIEALVFVPRGSTPLGGTLIAISERGRDRAGDHLAFLIGGPRPGAFTIKRKNDFDISDATMLPGGDLVLAGAQVRLDHRPLHPHPADSDRRDRARARWSTGRSCSRPISASRSTTWKGISVHRSGGETVLTLISDNNFSALQRTLLLQFTLAEP